MLPAPCWPGERQATLVARCLRARAPDRRGQCVQLGRAGVPGSAVPPGGQDRAWAVPGQLQDSPAPGPGSFQECPPNPIRTRGERLPCPKEPSRHKGTNHQVSPKPSPKNRMQELYAPAYSRRAGGRALCRPRPRSPSRQVPGSAQEGSLGNVALRSGLPPRPSPIPRPRARPARQRGARVPSTESPRRAGERRCQPGRVGQGPAPQPQRGLGLRAARGSRGPRARPARRVSPEGPRAGRSAPGLPARSGARRARRGRRRNVPRGQRPGTGPRRGQLPSLRNCAWITRTRKQQSAAPASAQSAFRSCIAECPLGRRPRSRAAKVQAPHQRPAGCSRRGRPLAPPIRRHRRGRRDWRRHSGRRCASFGQGEGRGGGRWGGAAGRGG